MTEELSLAEQNKILAKDVVDTKDLPELPKQIRQYYPKLTPDEELHLRLIAYKTTDFFKWLEAKHANILYSRFEQGNTWLDNINESIKNHEAKKPDGLDEDELKQWSREESRLKKMHASISEQWLAFSKELRVIAQNHLNREAPKKLEVTQVKVSPGDVANLIDNARRIVDIDKSND